MIAPSSEAEILPSPLASKRLKTCSSSCIEGMAVVGRGERVGLAREEEEEVVVFCFFFRLKIEPKPMTIACGDEQSLL